VGAAIATTASFAVNTGLHARYLSRFLDIEFPVRETAWSIVASLVMGICLYGLRSRVEIDTILDLIPVIGFGVLVYTIVAMAYGPIRTTVQSVIRRVV
jgi:hypothetical protein